MHIVGNVEEMDRILKKHIVPILTQEQLENLSRPTTNRETELVIKK